VDFSVPDRPVFDAALSRAVLRAVADGRLPETLRVYQPADVVAFSALDRVRPGFPAAVRAARAHGFGAVIRLAGGRAAVFHGQTLAFSWCIPDPEPRSNIAARFTETAAWVTAALQSLGIDARVGEVPGEYCPGEHSVNARGQTKLVGVGQRIVRGAAHVGGVIVVAGSSRVRDVLIPVYEALELEWDPATVGSLSDERPDVSREQLVAALQRELSARHAFREASLPDFLSEDARSLEAEHRVPDFAEP
jgi:lipoate-protein ligase A